MPVQRLHPLRAALLPPCRRPFQSGPRRHEPVQRTRVYIHSKLAAVCRSAAVLIVFATKRAMTKEDTSLLGISCLRFPARPCPVTLPDRAHIICTTARSSHVISAVQRSLVPNYVRATEQVAMPDGSSPAAPAIMPGPSDFSNERIQRVVAEAHIKRLFPVRCSAECDSAYGRATFAGLA